jgi:hypothetical protein
VLVSLIDSPRCHFVSLTFSFNLVGEGREGGRGPRGDRDDYRRKEAASGDFKPEFRGGLGRGRRE